MEVWSLKLHKDDAILKKVNNTLSATPCGLGRAYVTLNTNLPRTISEVGGPKYCTRLQESNLPSTQAPTTISHETLAHH